MPVGAHQLLIIVFADKLHVVLILVLEVHQMSLVHRQLPIWGEALALAAAGHICTRIAPIIAHVKLACRALLAQPLASVRVRRGLPGL